MKRLFFISLAIMLLFSSMAIAGDVSGQTYTVSGCNCCLVFTQGPFGPEEGGFAALKCQGISDLPMSFMYQPPILTLMYSVRDKAGLLKYIDLNFVMLHGVFRFIDPAGPSLAKH